MFERKPVWRNAPVRVAGPASAPVTLDEMKAHAIAGDFADDDALLQTFIDAATGYLDGYTGILGRALVTQTWRQDFWSFGDCLRLPIGPVTGVPVITYFDASNALRTLATSVYDVFTDSLGAILIPKPGQDWPSAYERRDAVSVVFDAGTEPVDVPPAIKVAIMMLAASWYQNRHAVSDVGGKELPFSVTALLAPYRHVNR